MSGIRCDVCDSGGVLSMHWSQSFALCDEHRHAPAKAAAIHAAEREVLEACVEWSKATDAYCYQLQLRRGMEADDVARSASAAEIRSRGTALSAVRRYRALLDAKAEGKGA